jgi:hypothetical protein
MAANASIFLKKSANTSTTIWQRPETRQKLNVDAFFCVDTVAGAIGAIIRDYKGNFVVATGKGIVACDDNCYGRGFGHERRTYACRQIGMP